MHYKNGREAKNGDKVVVFPSWGAPYIGILYDAQAGNDFCNGKVAPICSTDPCPNLQEVLHLDDVTELLPPSQDGKGSAFNGKLKDLMAVPDTSLKPQQVPGDPAPTESEIGHGG